MTYKIVKVLSKKKYFLIAFLASIFMLVIYPIIQSIPNGLNNLDLWFEIIKPFNFFLYFLFSFIFGILLALQIYNFNETKFCGINKGSAGFFGVISGMLITQCPACLSLGSFFLPLGVAGFLSAYNIYVMLVSICLMILGIFLLGGFKKS